jgi:squalene-hopene/tetraprenyl-beta-curcumene cyclase
LLGPTRHSILCARQRLLSNQRDDGAWQAIQIGDASLSAQLVLLLTYLGREQSSLAQQAAASILDQQSPTGGWSVHPDGQDDLSASVQCYLALKLIGLDPSNEQLSRARQSIRRLGGADAADIMTRFFLALFGQIDYGCCPAIPPEAVLFNRSDRRTGAPLSLIWSHQPVRETPLENGVRELFFKNPSQWPTCSLNGNSSAARFTLFTAPARRLLRYCERRGWTPLRKRSLERAESIMLSAIAPKQIAQLDFCALVWHTIALDAVGYSAESAERRACAARLQALTFVDEDEERAAPQLRATTFADTLLAIRALRASGLSERHLSFAAASKWLSRARHGEFLPSVPDIVSVLRTLSGVPEHDPAATNALPPDIEIADRCTDCGNEANAAKRRLNRLGLLAASLIDWLLQHQNRDGGWGTPEVTATVIQAIAGYRERARREIDAAIRYLRAAQQADGSWSDSSGAVHTTSLAVCALLAEGIDSEDDAIVAGLNWLRVEQSPAGDWRGSASYTALALDSFVAAGHANQTATMRAVNFLLETQFPDGSWTDPALVFHDAATDRWFRSDLHATALPLEALSGWTVAATPISKTAESAMSFRLVSAADDE